jgi:hypothetical protein
VVILGGSIVVVERSSSGIVHDRGDAYERALDLVLEPLATA